MRSGMVYSGKIYETDGAEAIGVHEAADVRPLAPVPTPPSIRIFRSDLGEDELGFYYVNPGAVIGPSQIVNLPDIESEFVVRSYLAATIGGGGYQVSDEEAEAVLLGLTLVNIVTAKTIEDSERRNGFGIGRSHDFGIAVGPVLTTPDDLDDVMVMTKNGILYKLECSIKVNQVERASAHFEEFAISMIDAVQFASQTGTLRPGDIFCVGPIFDDEDCKVSANDEFQFTMERLGTLALKINEQS
ncbi:MAG: fumarylacetoacetate hydrolase family protein [Armatimonadetes bacterium]|nr:fumarylacetoacetate hydrolase family protein [Armatimonadota bacterium]